MKERVRTGRCCCWRRVRERLMLCRGHWQRDDGNRIVDAALFEEEGSADQREAILHLLLVLAVASTAMATDNAISVLPLLEPLPLLSQGLQFQERSD